MSSYSSSSCSFCSQHEAKYTCPRCGLRYCSTLCYRSEKHFSCSNDFFKEWVIQTLASERVSQDVKKETIDILKRVAQTGEDLDTLQFDEDEDDEDSSEKEDIHTRFAGINLDDESEENTQKILSLLTDKERKEFETLVSSGDISKVISGTHQDFPKDLLWTPWWTTARKKLIVDAAEKEQDTGPLTSDDISLLKSIPQLSRSTSPLLRYSLLNVIHSYTFVCRYLNGEGILEGQEALEELLVISTVLKDGRVSFDSTALALKSSTQEMINRQHTPPSFLLVTYEDVQSILSLKESLFKVFCDIWKWSKGKKDKLLCKRVEFYLSYVRDNFPPMRALISDVEEEKTLLELEDQAREKERKGKTIGVSVFGPGNQNSG